MATSQEREDLFWGKGKFSTTPFYKAQNRTTGINRVNELLKDESLRKTMNPPYDISGYGSIFECTDIDLLEKLHDEIVKRPEDEASHNLLSSVLHTYIYMLCIIDEFGINDAIANRSKYETTNGKITWNKVKKAIDNMKKRNSTSSGTTGVSSAPSTVKKSVTPPVIPLGNKALECKELLEANHNIILSGAPGTGKTYMAKQIALAMTGSENRIQFVQFHPSYDYTDFVEGLRPTSTSCSTIGFERKDGIFKEFCEKALEALEEYNKSLTTIGSLSSTSTSMAVTSPITAGSTLAAKIEAVYKKIVADIKEGKKHTVKTVSGINKDLLVNENGNLYIQNPSAPVPLTLEMLLRISEKLKTSEEVRQAKNFREKTGIGNWDSDLRAIMIYIYSIIESEESETEEVSPETSVTELENPNVKQDISVEVAQSKEYPYFVFIIDEINRGEMSKVFGELFFSIDPGYRGTDGKVRTQYANMVTKPNAFDKVLGKTNPKDLGYFFVPENVYIIGTMNDIDRSVDSMDFAMRRRFLIKDIKAVDTQEDMLKLEIIQKIYPSVTAIEPKVVEKMNALNNLIEGKAEKKIKAKLGSSYSLGASYFQKYYKYNDFGKLWDYHLEGILREYLRGTQDSDSDLKVLKEAYENA